MGARLYPVVEIFRSRQGEGYNSGLEVVFLRLGGCNLACSWCDTEWRKFEMVGMGEIRRRLEGYGVKRVVVSGGEPTIAEGLEELLVELKRSGYWLALESNGLVRLGSGVAGALDYVAISPKVCYSERYKVGEMVQRADEVRVVAEEGVVDFCRWLGVVVDARRYYISPCDRGRGERGEGRVFSVQCSDREEGRREGYREALKALGELNGMAGGRHWELSVQAHKLAGIE